ncbi:MAG: rod shape-determining protein RodA [Calditrichia bacterium]|nr:rod shape-determining protein RodA [Calditrichota bacterium]MCB0267661.1 rod shape-determining protein RodA [Calditrichota bacterium]MCB0285075.1 rod shape-determining protein RodA [Calditrichota bacterium]MCB9070401.1 rod shape-determining protein RodA [Calditrichia bacterium]
MLNQIKKLDITMLLSLTGLLAMGLAALYSTSQSSGINFFNNQLQWIFLGTITMLTVAFMPNRIIYDFAYIGYAISLVFLVLIFFMGTSGYGATRWLRIAGVGFQPSELAKIATLLAVARYLSDERLDINRLKPFLIASCIFLVPFVLVAKQPDLGTALVFTIMVLPIFYWVGLGTEKIILLVTPGIVLFASFNYFTFLLVMIFILVFIFYYLRPNVIFGSIYFIVNIAVGLLTPLFWNQLKDYQKKRITTFWNPEADRLGSGYQIIQSKVAIGSGGFTGKGFLQGSQTQLRYLPEQHNDFIFAVIGEEFGFIGVMLGFALFTIFLIRVVQIANASRNRFRSVVAIGIGAIIGFHTFVNIGMTVGIFPVTGLPLPFISYGGTALLINMIMVGLLLNFYRHRYEY